MVIAADSAEVADAVGPSPSDASLRGLDGVNLLLAGALSGFGPYVAAFLAEQNWTQQSIGFVLTAGGFAGLLSQLPGGALLDAIRSKRIAVALGAGMVAAGALIIAVWPSFPLVLAALVLQGITGGFLGLAIVAISLGLVGNTALAERLGRNQRFASMGGVVTAGLMGLVAYFLSFRAIFFVAAALVLPLLVALSRIRPADIHFGRASCVPDHQGPGKPPRARLRSLWKNRGLLVFAGCVFLFQMANASVLPLAGEAFAYSKEALSSLIVAALIMVPQVIVAIIAPWAGRRANTWGRRPLLGRNPTCGERNFWMRRREAEFSLRDHRGYHPAISAGRDDRWTDAVGTAAGALMNLGDDINVLKGLIDNAVARNPSSAFCWFWSGWMRTFSGEPVLAIEHLEKSLRLDPRATRRAFHLTPMGICHLFQRRFDKAVALLEASFHELPTYPTTTWFLAACYAQMGRIDDARDFAARLGIRPGGPWLRSGSLFRNPEHREFLFSGLRLATGEQA